MLQSYIYILGFTINNNIKFIKKYNDIDYKLYQCKLYYGSIMFIELRCLY